MHNESSTADSSGDDLARECLYRFLSAVAAGPYSGAWERALGAKNLNLAREASRILDTDAGDCDIPHLVEQLQAPLDASHSRSRTGFRAHRLPGVSHLRDRVLPGSRDFWRASQQIADVAGFYRAFGIEPSLSSPERPDHLALSWNSWHSCCSRSGWRSSVLISIPRRARRRAFATVLFTISSATTWRGGFRRSRQASAGGPGRAILTSWLVFLPPGSPPNATG